MCWKAKGIVQRLAKRFRCRGEEVPVRWTGCASRNSSERAHLRSVPLFAEATLRSYQRSGMGAQYATHPLHTRWSELTVSVYGSWFQWESRSLSNRRLTIISSWRHYRPNDGVHRQSACLPRKRILCCLRFRVEFSRNLIPNRERHPRSRVHR